jgi:predicted MFS family arabinose efflux permease
MTNTAETPPLFSGGIAIFATLAVLFMFSQFLRVSSAVVARELTQDLGLSPSQLGLLGGAFFYSFALAQIPVGWALDRFPPRIVVALLPLTSAVGVFLFSSANGFTLALIGRILSGIGMSTAFMGSLKVFSIRYSPLHFATLAGVIISIGTAGNIVAATPLALACSALGWRLTFLLIGIVILFSSVIAYIMLRSVEIRPIPTSSTAQKDFSMVQGLKLLVCMGTFWQCSILAFFRYGTFVALQGLWGGPYLRDVHNFSSLDTGNILLAFSLGAVVGSALSGRISDRVFQTRKWVVLPMTVIYSLFFLALTGLVSISSFWNNMTFFFFASLFGSAGNIVYTQVKELVPAHITGLAVTSVNFFTMAGGAVFMHLLGSIMQRYPCKGEALPPEAYQAAFIVCFIGIAMSLIYYVFSKDSYPVRH